MKTTQERSFDTTWYFSKTRAVAEAALEAETAAILARFALGYIYVVAFGSGVVKVGKAITPKGRLAAHARLAATHGDSVQSVWVSRRLCGYGEAERALITLCGRSGRLVAGREYFAIDTVQARTLGSIVEHIHFAADSLPPDLLALLEGDAHQRAYGEDVAS